MKTLIVGAGAVGGFFGGRLLQASRDVTFMVRPHRAAALAKSGLRIKSPHGDLYLPSPSTITADQLTKQFDLVIVYHVLEHLPCDALIVKPPDFASMLPF